MKKNMKAMQRRGLHGFQTCVLCKKDLSGEKNYQSVLTTARNSASVRTSTFGKS